MTYKLLKVYTKNHEKHFLVDSDYYNTINSLDWKYDSTGDMIYTYIPSSFAVVKNLKCWKGKSITPGQAVAAVATGKRYYTKRIDFNLDKNFSFQNLILKPYENQKGYSDVEGFIDLKSGTRVNEILNSDNGVYTISKKRNSSYCLFINFDPKVIKKAKFKVGEKVSLSYQPKEKIYCVYSVNGSGQKGSTLTKNGNKFRFNISVKEEYLSRKDPLKNQRWYPSDVKAENHVVYFK